MTRSFVFSPFLGAKLGLVAIMLMLPGCMSADNPFRNFKPTPKIDASSGQDALAKGRRLLRLGEYTSAKRHFISAINRGAPQAEAFTGIGLSEEGLGHLHIALSFFERALKLAPASVTAHNNLGVVLFRLDRFHEAQQAFQAAYAISSGKSEIAQHNLRLVNLTVAEIDANDAGVVQSHRVLRIGENEYRLDQTAVTAKPVEDTPKQDTTE